MIVVKFYSAPANSRLCTAFRTFRAAATDAIDRKAATDAGPMSLAPQGALRER
jgi:hypothetical protein